MEDYIPFNKEVIFPRNEILQDIYVDIVDDNIWEPDEYFYVKLYVQQANQNGAQVLLGKTCIIRVTIINDDEPGTFTFSKPSYVVREGQGTAQVFVDRLNGADGRVSVQYRTCDLTAVDGRDYRAVTGTKEFEHGETCKAIEVDILKSSMKTHNNIHCERIEGLQYNEWGSSNAAHRYGGLGVRALALDEIPEMSNSFCVELFAPTAGAQIGKVKKCIVTIVSDEEFSGMVSRIAARTKENMDALRLEKSTWLEQFQHAININDGDFQTATVLDYVLHFCSFFWKVLFACVPPPSIGGGWLTFSLSLVLIGIMTAIVGDLASIFGCLVGLSDTITAITFVALGTSMPDTFASKQAALMEKSADSSIGNVNGSNAVNVFLGLGLPWLIASIYWNTQK
ncbi:hypothetical protein CHS0354_031989 [Potamilus streckersoni]|uniref:Calx-beta domain-containing protein n=1 Tax=Potamilus streckersoni TaxID=2493646 RepID=A0AAE0TL33_9BIVA|nr:hypothetical protein CHS0354_031989 [Potamilus streckersoni]